jgi:hypothetical protein
MQERQKVELVQVWQGERQLSHTRMVELGKVPEGQMGRQVPL